MPGKVTILGARGRFGRNAVVAFAGAGWHVQAAARSWNGSALSKNVEHVTVDVFDSEHLRQTVADADVVVNATNPLYPRWSKDVPRLTASIIGATRHSGATVLIPGNVYNFGAGMPALLSEDTAQRPTTRKGHLRVEMEAAYRSAGIRTIVLRAGDYIEATKTGNWFDSQILAGLAKGRVMYPGPMDRVHAWAYLPDLADAAVGLAERRMDFAPFESFGFPGYSLTGQELVAAIEAAVGEKLKVKPLSWPLITFAGLFSPMMREIAEVSYLWRVPHAIDGTKLHQALPGFLETPFPDAIRQAVRDTGGEPEWIQARPDRSRTWAPTVQQS